MRCRIARRPSKHWPNASGRRRNVDTSSRVAARETVARPKVVITGGAGVIGSHVADALVGQAEGVTVDHLRAGKRANLAKAIPAGAGLAKHELPPGRLRP